MPPVGIGIIAYHATHDLVRCLRAIQLNTDQEYILAVCDNTEGPLATNVAVTKLFKAHLVHQSTNVGCSVGRNLLWQWFSAQHPTLEQLVIMDQDVRVEPKWLPDMQELMAARANAGLVCWPCANMGNRPVRSDGCISKAASVCNLHSTAAIKAVGGWDPKFFMYRFDSLFADRLNNAGYRSYVQMKYFKPGVQWVSQVGGIIHDHPHAGIKRNPRWKELRDQSDRYYRDLMAREGWSEFDPMKESEHRWNLPPEMLRIAS